MRLAWQSFQWLLSLLQIALRFERNNVYSFRDDTTDRWIETGIEPNTAGPMSGGRSPRRTRTGVARPTRTRIAPHWLQ